MTVLIVGGGKMGMSHLALATQYLGKSHVALCDTKLSTRILFRLLGYDTFSNVDAAALVLDHLEGVLIATPTPSHASLAKWAIDKGVPCFIEKPLTLNVDASKQLRAMATAKHVPVQLGFVLRYVTSFLQLRSLVQHNQLGGILDYSASMRGNVILKPPAVKNWQGQFSMGGGCLNEYGPHIIDLCRFIFGDVSGVNNVRMNKVFCANADDQIDFNLSHSNGSVGNVKIDWCDNTKRKSVVEFKVKFKYADIRVDNSAFEIKWGEECSITENKRSEIAAPIRPFNVSYYLRGEEFSLQLEDFLGACIGRHLGVDDDIPSNITARLDDGCEVDRLIDEIARKAGLK